MVAAAVQVIQQRTPDTAVAADLEELAVEQVAQGAKAARELADHHQAVEQVAAADLEEQYSSCS